MKVAIVGQNFKGLASFGFAMATLQLFQHPENVKISILPFIPAEMLCKLNFQKVIILLQYQERGYCFKGSGILVLQWQRYNFSNIQKM